MFIKGIASIGFERVDILCDIIGYEIRTITGFCDFTTNKTFDTDNQSIIKSNLDIRSGFDSMELWLSRKIQIQQIIHKKVFIAIDDNSLIRKFDCRHFYDWRHLKVLLDCTDKLDLFVCIRIEIDSRTFETYFLTIRDNNRMRIIREVIVYGNLAGQRKRCSQGVNHVFLRCLC